MRAPHMQQTTLAAVLKSQYHASLAMLREAIEECPEELWDDATPLNAFWRIAYHAVFFAHLYLQPDEQSFVPWHGHQGDVQFPDAILGPPDPTSRLPLGPSPYSRIEVLEYCEFCDGEVDATVDRLDLESQESGFSWYPVSKLEHQFVNIRHIQHHAAQLADRVRAAAGVGVRWRGRG